MDINVSVAVEFKFIEGSVRGSIILDMMTLVRSIEYTFCANNQREAGKALKQIFMRESERRAEEGSVPELKLTDGVVTSNYMRMDLKRAVSLLGVFLHHGYQNLYTKKENNIMDWWWEFATKCESLEYEYQAANVSMRELNEEDD